MPKGDIALTLSWYKLFLIVDGDILYSKLGYTSI